MSTTCGKFHEAHLWHKGCTVEPRFGVWCVEGVSLHEEVQKLWKTEDYWAFACGVVVNVPLGNSLSMVVFSRSWSNISSLM